MTTKIEFFWLQIKWFEAKCVQAWRVANFGDKRTWAHSLMVGNGVDDAKKGQKRKFYFFILQIQDLSYFKFFKIKINKYSWNCV